MGTVINATSILILCLTLFGTNAKIEELEARTYTLEQRVLVLEESVKK